MTKEKKTEAEESPAEDLSNEKTEAAFEEAEVQESESADGAEQGGQVRAVFGMSSDGKADVRPRFGEDKYSFFWGLLSFFAPIVAFALRNLWRRTYPLRSKSMLIGSILGIIFYIALFAAAIALIVTRVILSKRFI